MSATLQPTQAFQTFLDEELRSALHIFETNPTDIYIDFHVNGPDKPSRRILVVMSSSVDMIFVSIEAAYHLFDGDIHYHVHQVGAIPHAEAHEKLRPLVEEAYRQVVEWKPNFANIEDNAFLPA